MAHNHSSWLRTAMAMFLPWSTLTFAARIWTKLRNKNWGLDDYCISAAMLAAIAHIAATCVAIRHGYGRPMAGIPESDLAQAKKALYAGQILYILSIGLCKISAAFLVAHMTYFGPQSRPAYAFVGLSTSWTLASILAVAFRGNPRRPWDTMEGTKTMYLRWIGIETTGLVIEFGLWILSIHLVWGLQVQKQKLCFIISAFGARLGLLPIITYRLAYLCPVKDADQTLDTVLSSILTQGAIHFSIIAGSITCLKPLLRTFSPPRAAEGCGKASTSCNGTRDSYFKLDTLKRRQQNVVDSDDSANWRPFEGSGERHVVALPPKPHVRAKDKTTLSRHKDRESICECRGGPAPADLDGAERLVIQRTTEVLIKYEHKSSTSQ